MWYIIITFFVSVVALLGYKKDWVGLFITGFLLFLLMFRGDNVGHDTKAYLDPHFLYIRTEAAFDVNSNNMQIDTYDYTLELISNKLYEVVFYNNLSPRIVLYFYAIITIVFLYFAFKRFRVNIALGMMFFVLLGLFFFSMTASRQMAAVSVVAFGMSFILDDSIKKYLFFLFILIASLIHASAIFFIWLYLLRFVKVKRNPIIIASAIICFVFTILPIDIMAIVYGISNVQYISRYAGQFDSTEKHILGSIIGLLSFVFYFSWLQNNNKKYKTDFYEDLYLIGLLSMALFSSHSILLIRVTYYVTIFICVFLSKELEKQPYKRLDGLLWMFLILRIYMAKDWLPMLESDYYLMF